MPTIEVIRGDKTTLVRLKTRKLSSLSDEEQNRIVRSYLPKLEEDTKLLITLMDKRIFSQKSAVRLKKTGMVRKLIRQGQLKETKDGRVFLTEFGQRIASGAKIIYE